MEEVVVLLAAVVEGFTGVVVELAEMVDSFCEVSSVGTNVVWLGLEEGTVVVISVGSSVTVLVWGREVAFGFLSVSSCFVRLRFAGLLEKREAGAGSVSWESVWRFFQVILFSSLYWGGAGAMVEGGDPYSQFWRAGTIHIVV